MNSVTFSPVAYDNLKQECDENCAICLGPFKQNNEIVDHENRTTKERIGHLFHRECLEPWLKVNRLCPICKAEVEISWKEWKDKITSYLKDPVIGISIIGVVTISCVAVANLFPDLYGEAFMTGTLFVPCYNYLFLDEGRLERIRARREEARL